MQEKTPAGPIFVEEFVLLGSIRKPFGQIQKNCCARYRFFEKTVHSYAKILYMPKWPVNSSVLHRNFQEFGHNN